MTHSFAISRIQQPSTPPTPLQIVARKYKVGTLRQLADIYTLKLGPNYLKTTEYYAHEVYRPDLTQSQKRAFVGEQGSTKLNATLHRPNTAYHAPLPRFTQNNLEQHAEIADLIGSYAINRLRVVTVAKGGAIRTLYALWKIPEPRPHPYFGGMIGEIDVNTGKVRSMRKGIGTDTQWPITHPKTRACLMGATLPHWQSVLDLARAAHETHQSFALLGWDIAICPNGARLIGCTANPHHGLYQFATARGILNRTFVPVFDEIKASH
jgi:hypothetical protein